MTDFERIITSAPVNSQAARQMGKGEHFTPRQKFNQVVYDVMPPLRPVPETLQDLTGVSYGRLKVMGLRQKQKRAMWVCRCVCGYFVERSPKAVLNRADGECPNCNYTRKIRSAALPGMKNHGRFE